MKSQRLTQIELSILIAVIGILSAILLPALTTVYADHAPAEESIALQGKSASAASALRISDMHRPQSR
jgi:Tfp pilus assembly protein PilE